MVRIYNTWMADFCRHYPDDTSDSPTSLRRHRRAVAEVHRVAKPASRASSCSCSWEMEPMWHPLGAVWAAIDEVGIPLTPHRSRRCRPTCARSNTASPARG